MTGRDDAAARAGAPASRPVYLTSFTGRGRELATVAAEVAEHRLVTLTGPGGVGKTRLAAEATARAPAGLPAADAVCWVDLATVGEPELLVETILGALGVADAPGRPARDRLIDHLRDQELLLVLDNCEHLRAACAGLVDPLLRSCPRVRILATSREGLGVAGERTWPVPALELPAREEPGQDTPDRTGPAARGEAVDLFAARAGAVLPGFALSADSARVVDEICLRLDGLPLAIELAAARVNVLSLRQILAGLVDRFRLLTGGGAGPGRWRALEASVAWSHDLLDARERVLFRRLAVFAGGFDLAAAEAVAPGPDVLDLVASLVAKSLVAVTTSPEAVTARYRLLETVRAYAAARLADAGEADAVRSAHLGHYRAAALRAEAALVGVTAEVLRTYAVEAGNYRAALGHAEATADAAAALEIVHGHAFLLYHRGRTREAIEALERALAVPGGPAANRSRAFWLLGLATWYSGDMATVGSAAKEALRLAEEAEDRCLQGRAHNLLGGVHILHDPSASRAANETAWSMAEETGDAWLLMEVAADRAYDLARCDDLDGALRWYDRSQSLAREYGSHWFESWGLLAEAAVALRRAEFDRSRSAATRSFDYATALGDWALAGLGTALLAEVDVLTGAPADALARAEPAIAECTRAAADIALPTLQTMRAQALAALGREARAAHDEALASAVRVDDPWQLAAAASAAARFALAHGDLGAARGHVALVRRCAERLNSRWTAAVADHLAGRVAAAAGQAGEALNLQYGALSACARGGYPIGVVDALEALAEVVGEREPESAARLLGFTAARRAALGYRLAPPRAAAPAVRAALDEERFALEWAAGSRLDVDDAIAYALRSRRDRRRLTSGWNALTPAELDVARLAAEGLSNAAIARRLFVSPGTVKVHLSHIYAKLGIANRTELAVTLTRRDGTT